MHQLSHTRGTPQVGSGTSQCRTAHEPFPILVVSREPPFGWVLPALVSCSCCPNTCHRQMVGLRLQSAQASSRSVWVTRHMLHTQQAAALPVHASQCEIEHTQCYSTLPLSLPRPSKQQTRRTQQPLPLAADSCRPAPTHSTPKSRTQVPIARAGKC
jgi:hypothetical protein